MTCKKSPLSARQARYESIYFPSTNDRLQPLERYATQQNSWHCFLLARYLPGSKIALRQPARRARIQDKGGNAIIYAVSTTDKIDPAAVARIERKLDRFLERLDDSI